MKPRVLSDFEGRWRLSREISHNDGSHARFDGTALWQPADGGLVYCEKGQLQIPGQPTITAERKYLWQDGLRVCFEDGRFFHQVPDQGGHTSHWCDPDQYDVHYTFDGWPRWSSAWQVQGPRKSYRLRSDYAPV